MEGEYTLVVSGGEEMRLSSGSFASVGRGTLHASKVTGKGPGRCLKILTPPGSLERFLEEVGVPVANRSSFARPEDAPEMEEVVASGRRHGTYRWFVGSGNGWSNGVDRPAWTGLGGR